MSAFPVLSMAELNDFIETGETLLFFTGDPDKRPESRDLDVILPELVAAFGGRFGVAKIDRDCESEAAARFGVVVYPSLVALRGAKVLGVIAKLRDWAVYTGELQRLFNGQPEGATS